MGMQKWAGAPLPKVTVTVRKRRPARSRQGHGNSGIAINIQEGCRPVNMDVEGNWDGCGRIGPR
jgi:hypothetical protein